MRDMHNPVHDSKAALEKLTRAAEEIVARKRALAHAEALYDKEKAEYEKRCGEFQAMLEACGLYGFDHPLGKFTLVSRTSVKVPKTEEERAEFFEYLRSRGIFDSMITVNSQTLNAWYRAEEEAQLASGVVDFQVPGLAPPVTFTQMQVRMR